MVGEEGNAAASYPGYPGPRVGVGVVEPRCRPVDRDLAGDPDTAGCSRGEVDPRYSRRWGVAEDGTQGARRVAGPEDAEEPDRGRMRTAELDRGWDGCPWGYCWACWSAPGDGDGDGDRDREWCPTRWCGFKGW